VSASPADTLRQIVMDMHRLATREPNTYMDRDAQISQLAESVRNLANALLSERAPLNQPAPTGEHWTERANRRMAPTHIMRGE
jgi:hypothetical protein